MISSESQFTTISTASEIEILLVDDDAAFCERVGKYLEAEYEMSVSSLTSPSAAVELLSDRHDFECIVSDYDMPGMDGLEFLKTIKQSHPGLPFILFAGQGSEQVASDAIHFGADDYLQKDTGEQRYDVLARRIRNCVTIARQQQSLDNLYRAVENAGHAMLITDESGCITYANPTMADISGYSVEELRGETPAMLQSGEHGEEFYEDLWQTILAGEVWQGEVTNQHKNGVQYVVDQTISPILDTNGSITGFVAISRDITDRKHRERELAFFEQAVEQIGTGIAAYGTDGSIVYANPAYATMLGTTGEDLEGTHVTELNPEFERERFEDYWESFDDGETRTKETQNRRLDDGSEFPVVTVTTHISIDGHEYHVGTIRDISERRERERKLQKFYQAVEHAGHAVVITERDGTIEYVNPAFEAMTGYSEDEALGETPAILQSGEHGDEFYEDMWSTILAGDVWEGEIVNRRKDGSRYTIEQTIAPLATDGEITHFVGINNEITELKAYEAQLERQKAELERQNERLTSFGRTVAHDLRNPLNVLRANLEQSRHETDPSQTFDKMEECVERMETLIDKHLTLAKQGQSVLEPKPASLEAVATTAWEHVETAAMTLDVRTDETILMDDSRTQDIFENLYRNAREHAGSDVRIRVGTLEDGFYVEDNGPGIPPDQRDTVLDSGYTTADEGTGFGLSIVAQIADAHNWQVDVTSSDAGGARFEFSKVDFA